MRDDMDGGRMGLWEAEGVANESEGGREEDMMYFV